MNAAALLPAAPPASAATGATDEPAAAFLPVDLDWHSGSAVLSDVTCDGAPRYLLATAWRYLQTAQSPRLIAQHASLMPRKPTGAAELMLLAFSRRVLLRAAGDVASDVAIVAVVCDRELFLTVPLPWQLRPADLAAVNELRRVLSGTLGAQPKEKGESASELQLRLMRLLVAERPPLTPQMAAAAAAAATALSKAPATPADEQVGATEFLPPLQLDGAVPVTGAAAEDEAEEGSAEQQVAKKQKAEAAQAAFEDDVDLELLDG